MLDVSKVIQHRKSEFGLIIIVIILSGVSASLLIFAPLDIISYATFRDVAIIPSVIAIFIIGVLARSKFPHFTNRLFVGMASVAIASVALVAIRIPGYMFA
jgi:FtsH-binding integral membrane protein